MKRILLLVFLATAMIGCNMFESHPYSVHVNYKNINAENIRLIEESCQGKETLKFVWMGDTQRWYDETKKMVRHINERGDIDFVMHGGDITDFGMGKEFDWIHREMKNLKVPYVALIGNHDILGNGHDYFLKMYGEVNMAFTAGHTRFVCLNTNALEFDYSFPVPDFEFIRQEIIYGEGAAHDQTIVTMHANPYGEQFNNNAAYPFQEYIKRLKNLQFCVHAHAHKLMVNDFFDDGILYYGSTSMKDRSYMVFTVSKDTYSYEVVDF